MNASSSSIRTGSALAWQSTVSGQAVLRLSDLPPGGPAGLRMDFDFQGGAGFVVARCAMSRSMPEDYAVRFRLRGRGPSNDLELKLVDASGQNVWRHVIKGLRPPVRWRRMAVTSHEIEFAWGPLSGRGITALGALEFAIVAGEGGRGSLCIADLEIDDLIPAEPPRVSASSSIPGSEPVRALTLAGAPGAAGSEGGKVGPAPDGAAGWRPGPGDERPWITIDSIRPRTLGGLIVDWLGAAPARGFRLRVSNTGRRWNTVYTAEAAGGERSYVYLPGVKARFLRLELNEPAGVAALRPQSFEFSRSIEAFWYAIADAEPRGWHPRWLHREQTLWTPLGIANGAHCALMNSDGMVEVGEGSFSIEPLLRIGDRTYGWADVSPRQELLDGLLPVPCVVWETPQWRLRIQAEATPGGVIRLRYRVDALSEQPLSGQLYIVVRPFQVTPPWQKYRNVGGVRPIHRLAWRDGTLRVDESWRVVPQGQAAFGALRFDQGLIASRLARGALPPWPEVADAFGFAAGAIRIDVASAAHGCAEHVVHCVPETAAAASVEEPAFDWRLVLPLLQWAGTGWVGDAVATALTATAHILVTRSGAALQPGPRRYTRSWIRDGAMMSAALLRMGRAQEVRDFIGWYAPHQRADGFVPCCVDRDGIDWLVEHDSHGQLLALIADYHRFSADRAFLIEHWRFVERAVSFIDGALDATGLLPVSVSHEGYLAQPVHSYWDDFWALRGLNDAVTLARHLGRDEVAERWEALATRFAASLFGSVADTCARRGLGYIPGSIEWADFDPTATANALYLLDIPAGLDRAAVEFTFDKYLSDWRAKRSGAVAWSNYTPYEIRIIGALVRLGRREAALELLRFFLADQRPPPWNQWPEIAWRDPKAPAHLGDLPHTWIAAEYVLAVGSLFAYERPDGSLVLAAGLAPEWIEGEGVRVRDMPTAYGALSYTLRRIDAVTVVFETSGIDAAVVLRPPLPAPLRSVMVNGAARPCDADCVTLPAGATHVVFKTG
jgi:hypothetical protein